MSSFGGSESKGFDEHGVRGTDDLSDQPFIRDRIAASTSSPPVRRRGGGTGTAQMEQPTIL